MTTPEVTPEIRAAVYAEDCKNTGHILSIEKAYDTSDEFTQQGKHAPDVQGPDNETFAHIYCRRCGRVWLVLEDSGIDYEDAVKKFKNLLKKSDQDKVVNPKRPDPPHPHGLVPHTHEPPPEEIGKPKEEVEQ